MTLMIVYDKIRNKRFFPSSPLHTSKVLEIQGLFLWGAQNGAQQTSNLFFVNCIPNLQHLINICITFNVFL